MELYNDLQRFISFTSDYGFKATFGNESNQVFLCKALQAMIDSGNAIEEVIFDKNTFDGVELGKFTLTEEECVTDLQKLLFTMKTINKEI